MNCTTRGLELALPRVEEVREVLDGRRDLRDEALRSREERHEHRGADLRLARHRREHLDAGLVEDLALVVAALDLELGLVLGPLQRDLRRAAAEPRRSSR